MYSELSGWSAQNEALDTINIAIMAAIPKAFFIRNSLLYRHTISHHRRYTPGAIVKIRRSIDKTPCRLYLNL
jgi:hypothetical protein